MINYLKTKLLILGTILVPFSSLAEHTPYFKGIFGINKINKIANFNNSYQKSNFSPDIGLGGGVGYSFDNTFRGEVLITYTNLSFSSRSKMDTFYDLNVNTRRVIINSAMFNIYKDFFEITENINMFAGVGVGVSQITEYITWESFSPNTVTRNRITFAKGITNRKTVYNFSHSIIAGLDFKVSDKINMELTYQFKNNGITPSKKLGKINVDQKHYLVHNIYTGFRYNL